MSNVHPGNTASEDYAKVLNEIEEGGFCPFCREHLFKHHTKPILTEGDYWILTENFKPYPGTMHHLLAIAKEHVTHFKDLEPAAYQELFALVEAELERRGIEGGGLFMRFGNSDYNFSSVAHLHAQVVVGVKRDEDTELLLVPLGFKKKGS